MKYKGGGGETKNTISIPGIGASQITIKNCAATAGVDGESDLQPVFDSLKGCPTALVNLLSPADGGPAVYKWANTSSMNDIGNLLLFGPAPPSFLFPGGTKRGENVSEKEVHVSLDIPLIWTLTAMFMSFHIHTCMYMQTKPPVSIELSGQGPLRTGPWAAHSIAFRPSADAPLSGIPFEIARGDADLSDVMFSNFTGPVLKVYTL